ncbi:MAG: glycosyltransferase [Flavobacteriales bacterium]|nr:glycosyltransferase [Flavobacteriales bacterium]
MLPGEPILILNHFFPPIPDIGGRRWAKFAKELARRGHPVHVIRREQWPGEGDSLWTADVAVPGVVQHPVPARIPPYMAGRPLASITEKILYRAWLLRLRLCTKGNYYDAACRSRKGILAEASRLIRQHGIRHVVASGAPFHLLGHAVELKARFPGTHLVVDFRDEWTWAGHYGYQLLSGKRQRVEDAMEARVVHEADRVISPSQEILDHLRQAHGAEETKMYRVPHTVDPDDLRGITDSPPAGRFRMIYAGSLYGWQEMEEYFRALMDAFDRLRETSPSHFANCFFDLYITGPGADHVAQEVRRRQLDGHIRFHAPLPPREILRQIAGSHLVVNFFPRNKKDILGTKFHEVFLLRRPILHVGVPGLVSRTLIGRRLGDSVRVGELAAELPRIIRGERKIAIDPGADHGEFLLGPVTDRLVREVLT